MAANVLRKGVLRRLALACLFLVACGDDRRPGRDGGFDAGSPDGSTELDAMRPDAPFSSDAACATASSMAEVSLRPVDIIWMVDNSTSMEPAIREVQAGLNDFASRVGTTGLDYRVIMLSLQGTSASDRYPVCIPPPLAGDGSCGDGDRFFHVSVDIRSTQPVEQFLGTLAQTSGYSEGEARGSAPWRELLRDDATKTIVVVTDDNSRTCDEPGGGTCSPSEPPLTVTSLEDFPGGGNPFSSRELGPGILTDTYGDLFEGYTFNAIYGWGSETNPDAVCTYPDSSEPPSPGPTYTALVERTDGVRAQICDQADSSAWDDFFEAIATRVEETARLDCTLALPPPPDGMMLNPSKVNVFLEADGDAQPFFKVTDESACGALGGWYYDDDTSPTEVNLCPASCEMAQDVLREAGAANISGQFGCDTLLI